MKRGKLLKPGKYILIVLGVLCILALIVYANIKSFTVKHVQTDQGQDIYLMGTFHKDHFVPLVNYSFAEMMNAIKNINPDVIFIEARENYYEKYGVVDGPVDMCITYSYCQEKGIPVELVDYWEVTNDTYQQNTTTDDRDDHIHQNIMDMLEGYQGKKVLVVCGFGHLYPQFNRLIEEGFEKERIPHVGRLFKSETEDFAYPASICDVWEKRALFYSKTYPELIQANDTLSDEVKAQWPVDEDDSYYNWQMEYCDIFKANLSETSQHYNHGDDGYYCLLDEVEYKLKPQVGDTCWMYSAVATMVTTYERKSGNTIDVDPIHALDFVLPDESEDGFSVQVNEPKTAIGGWTWLVTESLSNGFDEYVLDDANILEDFDADAVKEYLKNTGAVCVVVPDRDQSHMQHKDNYITVNYVTNNDEDYDHQVALVGWDDDFPKDYFKDKATQDGAWIAYNSGNSNGLYYISYDTKLRQPIGLSMSDEYAEVLSYDCGNETDANIMIGTKTKVANVFDKSGTLAAVGVYNIATEQDVTIEIYSKDFSQLLYSQPAHMDTKGYHVLKLDEPVDVDGFAIAGSFEKGAPVEGETLDYGSLLYTTVSHPGESYIYLNDSWQDLTAEATLSKLGLGFTPNNACIKGLMIEEF